MIIFELLLGFIGIGLFVFLITQITIPSIQRKPWFPWFRNGTEEQKRQLLARIEECTDFKEITVLIAKLKAEQAEVDESIKNVGVKNETKTSKKGRK